MSVIIKGMGMPKRHLFEAFVAIGDGQIVVKDLEKNKLFEGEIKGIPTPHGRLIDADKLMQWIEHVYGDKDIIKFITDDLKRQPTIIEAEVSE